MLPRFRVHIDLERLAMNIARAEEQVCSVDEAREWLLATGFDPDHHGTWVCDQRCLAHLNTDEYQVVEVLH